jgi:hypothetical protein
LTLLKTGTYTELMANRRVPLLACAVAAVALWIAAGPQLAAQSRERSMYVSALNDAGAPVPNLTPSDFIVREDNVAREVLRVEPATDPMQIAILVDNSQAARAYIVDIRNALVAFVNMMGAPSASGAHNEMSIIALADRPTKLADYTTSRAQLLKGIDRVFSVPQAGTLLLDGVMETSKALKKRGAMRPVIVAMVTQGPEFSDRYYDQVLQPLYDSGAQFHALEIGAMRSATSDAVRDRGMVLDVGTQRTGGRHDSLVSSMALEPKMKEVADELLHQYKLTYAHPDSLIPPDKVTVTASHPGLTVRGSLAKEPPPQAKK